nr:RNA-directed DNA polymerase, eukaryota, reverse transcriptase zinc-binding domain protein [Tanacetum cinerariifolium]
MGKWSQCNIDTIILVLDVFYRTSGLRININKSNLTGIFVDTNKVKYVVAKIDVNSKKPSWVRWKSVLAAKDVGVVKALHGEDKKIGKKVQPSLTQYLTPSIVSWPDNFQDSYFTSKYKDKMLFDVVDTDACHIILGKPWVYDPNVIYKIEDNTYKFKHNGGRSWHSKRADGLEYGGWKLEDDFFKKGRMTRVTLHKNPRSNGEENGYHFIFIKNPRSSFIKNPRVKKMVTISIITIHQESKSQENGYHFNHHHSSRIPYPTYTLFFFAFI